MRIFELIVGICLLCAAPSAAQVRIAPPEGGETRSVALILTDTAHEAAALDLAARLRAMHTATVVLDARETARRALRCDTLGGDLAALAQQAGAGTIAPVLVGLGRGADLALAAAQADASRFKGLATLDFPGPTCAAAPAGKAPVRWHDVGLAPAAPDLRGVRHYSSGDGAGPALTRAYLALAGTDHAFAPAAGAAPSGFPITLHVDPTAPETDVYAIFLSGDGGWARFDQQIAERLAAQGAPVVGLSTLRYLWQERAPADIARDMARLDAHFAARLGRRRVLLIGFSLGANVTPFYAPLLPDAMRARVAGLALLSPETTTGFEIVIGGWLGRATGARDVAAAIAAAAALRPLCVFGRDDGASACPAVDGAVATHAFDGGHHLGGDYDRIAALILGLAAGDAGAEAPALTLR